MEGGFGYRNWNATLPPPGEEWRELDEFNALSDRAFTEQLKPLRHAGPLQPDDIALVCVVRDEALRLPLFFDHYKKIGVSRFLVIDNASQDNTADVLWSEPCADIFHTTASYSDSCFGIYWQNGMARALCVGHWTLLADADELFVYDGMDEHGLADLSRWLHCNRQDRVFAPMIDVYPSGVIGETGRSAAANLAEDSWFDRANYALDRKPGGWLMLGGPRQRLFGKSALINGQWSSKHPFFHMREETAIFNAHFIWPRDEGPARPLGALIHLKFMDDFAERSVRLEREGQHRGNSESYRIINEKLAEQPRLVAFSEKSEKYHGPSSLIRHKLLMPIDWNTAGDEVLLHQRTMGGIDYRHWTGVGLRLVMSPGEREEFEDYSRRTFDEHLMTVRCRGHLAPDEVGLVCVLRNEVARLPLFFDHYKRLGVDRFFMIDNNSEDGSRDLLLAESRADIFHARPLFSEGQGGLYWAQAVVRRYAEGNWVVRADADELFVYDQMEAHGLDALARWLDRHGMDRVYAPMIDLYPSSPIGRSSQTIAELIRTDSWFDNDGYSLERWPQGWRLTGGPRFRLFNYDDSHRNLMWKYPFFAMRPDTIIFNHHWLWPYDTVTNGALGAMVHLKLMHDFIERSACYEREGQHWKNSNAYRVINRRVKENPEVVAFYEGSKRYRGPKSLLHHGMLMPIDWQDEGRTRVGPQIDPQGQRAS